MQHGNRNSITTNSQTFKSLFDRMLGNWPVPDVSTRAEKARLFRELFEHYGDARFASGVERAIRQHFSPFFPTVAEFAAYIPERKASAEPVAARTMEEILEKQKEWDEPETRAVLQRIDKLIKGGWKSMEPK